MKIIAINGSPRKNNNTGILLNHAIEGAKSYGAETQLINLYDLNYKGCVSCFACKIKNGKSYGKCSYQDELTPILNQIQKADAIILGSPIYFASITGEMRSFLERLIFPYLAYTKEYRSLFGRKLPVGFIYTMNVTKEQMPEFGYNQFLHFTETFLENIFGYFKSLSVNDTYQFDDYSKYVATAFNSEKKAKVREEEFPTDCKNAYNLGMELTQTI